jgi:threonine aldolase
VTESAAVLPPAPDRSFASDNSAGAHPEVLAALAEANEGHALAYGNDRWTDAARARFRELFGSDTLTLLAWNGTGANVIALQTLLPKYGAVICARGAHVDVDETGAPERILGAKLIDLPTPDGKLRPSQITEQLHVLGTVHHAQPVVVSITQSTELGTLYSVDEVAAICEVAHEHGLLVHLDGARIANATAALRVPVSAFTTDVGVDAISFGGTKNGLLFGEAVVFPDGARATEHGAHYLQKQTTQLPSKMRFVAAQFLALLDGDRWVRSARHANAMATRLYDRVASLPQVKLDGPPAVNALFPVLERSMIEPLQAWCPHYTWDDAASQVRWMTSWDTTDEDVDRFAAGVAALSTSIGV